TSAMSLAARALRITRSRIWAVSSRLEARQGLGVLGLPCPGPNPWQALGEHLAAAGALEAPGTATVWTGRRPAVSGCRRVGIWLLCVAGRRRRQSGHRSVQLVENPGCGKLRSLRII